MKQIEQFTTQNHSQTELPSKKSSKQKLTNSCPKNPPDENPGRKKILCSKLEKV